MKYCESCDIYLDTQKDNCVYCSTILQNSEYRPDALPEYLPFSLDAESIKKNVVAWFHDGIYTPDNILERAFGYKITFIYLPYYSYEITYDLNWQAKYNVWETEYYWDSEYDSSLQQYKQVQKTRSVLQTYTKKGHNAGTTTFNLPYSKKHSSGDICTNTVEIANKMSDVVIYPSYSSKELLEKAKIEFEHMINDEISKKLPYGSVGFNMKYAINDFKEHFRFVMVPEYQLTYEYDGKCYVAYINQSGKVSGCKPQDELLKKELNSFYIKANVTVILILVALIGCLYFTFTYYDENFKEAFIISMIFSIIIFIIATYKKYTKRKQTETKINTNRERNLLIYGSHVKQSLNIEH